MVEGLKAWLDVTGEISLFTNKRSLNGAQLFDDDDVQSPSAADTLSRRDLSPHICRGVESGENLTKGS